MGSKSYDDIFEMIADALLTIAAYLWLEPLAGFTAYLCLQHSIPSILSQTAQKVFYSDRKRICAFLSEALPSAFTASLVTIILMALARAVSPEKAIIETIFLGLFALTVPHVTVNLVAQLEQRRSLELRHKSAGV